MKIGVLEICQLNHYVGASVVAKAFAFKETNEVYFILEEHIAKLHTVDLPNNISLIIKTADESWQSFINKINALQLDILHINTVTEHLRMFSEMPFNAKKVSFSPHNTDDYFDNNLVMRTKKWWFLVKKGLLTIQWKIIYTQTVFFIKSFWRQYYKNKFVKNLLQRNSFFVVYTQGQAAYLSNFVDRKCILVLPFALYEPSDSPLKIIENSFKKTPIRISIPGVVTNDRRDYNSLLKVLEDNITQISGKFIWDFLGVIPKDEAAIIPKIMRLKMLDVDIQYYESFILEAQFNENASQADIILGNLKTQLSPFQKYGQTKESGTIFHMIQYAKPGLLPQDYPLDDCFKPSTLVFSDYQNLIEILLEIEKNREKLFDLKEIALKLSTQFTPKMIFERDLAPLFQIK